MQNRIFVTLRTLSNTSGVILAVLSLLHPESGSYTHLRAHETAANRGISKNKHRIYRNFNQWRTAILLSFGYDPLECPDCKHKMVLLELYYKHKRVPLEELYEKVMSNSLGKRSSA